ncbi:MAG: hypothetical protein RLZZ374_1694 [Cyanobacteriota bacterium]|jgi:hypothetical protein
MANRDSRPMDKSSQRPLSQGSLSRPERPRRPAKPLGLVGLALLVGVAGCADPNAWKRTACEQAQAQLGAATVQQIEVLRKALGLAAEADPVAYCRSIGAAMGSSSPTPAEGQSPRPTPNARPTTSATGRPLSAAEQAPGR